MTDVTNDSFELHANLKRDGILLGSFELCQVLLLNDRNYPWFVLVPQRPAIQNLIDLNLADHRQLWEESRVLGAAIMQIFAGERLNVAALGNVTPQLHVHHIVRHSHDPAWPASIWGRFPMSPYQPGEVEAIAAQIAGAEMDGFRD